MLVSRCLQFVLLIPVLVLTGCGGVSKTSSPHQAVLLASYEYHPDSDITKPTLLVGFDFPAVGKNLQLIKDTQLVLDTQKLQAQAAEQTKARQATTVSSAPRASQSQRPTTHTYTTVGGHIPYNYATWMRVHMCEQPDTWHAGGHFGNGLPAGGNGLGFSLYAWQDGVRYAAQRGVILPASGWDATPDQQMQVAQAMLDATGGGPACL